MESTQIKRIYHLLDLLDWKDIKELQVKLFTKGRTMSLKEMTLIEGNRLEAFLAQEKQRKSKEMIAKIIHLLTAYGFSTSDGSPDYPRINKFVENIGSRNPNRRKNIHQLKVSELPGVVTQVEAMVKKSYKF